jgi:hypothetical protein
VVKTHCVNGGHVQWDGDLVRLTIPPTTEAAYADAQLDDYDATQRIFANAPPQLLKLRARFSSNQLKGTAGFGFWNAPFGQEGQVLATPCNVWFFHGSSESDMRVVRGLPGHGFKAAMLNSPQIPSGQMRRTCHQMAAIRSQVRRILAKTLDKILSLPVASQIAMRAAQAIVNAKEAMLNLDMTAWHTYELDWQRDYATFRVDGIEVLRAPKPPNTKLGFVAWIDNYRAIAANGKYAFGYVACPHEQWLELHLENGKIPPR